MRNSIYCRFRETHPRVDLSFKIPFKQESILPKSKNLVPGLSPSASEKCLFLNDDSRENEQLIDQIR